MLEARAVLMLAEKIAVTPSFRRSVVSSLQDNQPCSAALAKGRSPTFYFNVILRTIGSLCLGAQLDLKLPWTDTKRQPADYYSRL